MASAVATLSAGAPRWLQVLSTVWSHALLVWLGVFGTLVFDSFATWICALWGLLQQPLDLGDLTYLSISVLLLVRGFKFTQKAQTLTDRKALKDLESSYCGTLPSPSTRVPAPSLSHAEKWWNDVVSVSRPRHDQGGGRGG